MEIFMGPGTYAGTPWIPDEVAKALVQELSLKDGDTVSKDRIVEYLGKQGFGPLWATDVAMVLRNMFGVTATFYESKALVGELSEILEGKSEPSDPELTEQDVAMAIAVAVTDAFNSVTSSEEEAVIAALSMESFDTISNIDFIANSLPDGDLEQIEACYNHGGEPLVEAWYEISFRPHMTRFMSREIIEAVEEAIGESIESLLELNTIEKQRRREAAGWEMRKRATQQALSSNPGVNPNKLRQKVGQNIQKMNAPDPLAAKVGQSQNQAGRYHADKSAAGDVSSIMHGKGRASGEQGFIRKNVMQGKAALQHAKQNPIPLPKDTTSAPSAVSVPHAQSHPVKSALSTMGRVASRAGNAINTFAHSDKVKSTGQALAKHGSGLFRKIGAAAKTVAGGVGKTLARSMSNAGDAIKAKARVRMPGLTYALHGPPSPGELQAAQSLGLHKHYRRMGHPLSGYDPDVHDHEGGEEAPRQRSGRQWSSQRRRFA